MGGKGGGALGPEWVGKMAEEQRPRWLDGVSAEGFVEWADNGGGVGVEWVGELVSWRVTANWKTGELENRRVGNG